MKKLFFLISLLMMSSIVHADDAVNLVIRQKAGNETIFSLDSNPVITFDEEYMIVRNDFANFSLPIAGIDQYNMSGTSDIKEMNSQPRYANGQVFINDLPKGTKAYIHSLDGKLIREILSDGIGTVTFNVRDLPKASSSSVLQEHGSKFPTSKSIKTLQS